MYLPVIRRNTTQGLSDNGTNSILSMLVDDSTRSDSNITGTGDYIDGYRLTDTSAQVVLDQGIEGTAIGNGDDTDIDTDLKETQYIIEMDNRFGYLADGSGNPATPSFIDDDNIASYYLSTTTNTQFFGDSGRNMSGDVILGPRGTRLQFLLGPSIDLASSTYLFTQLGTTATLGAAVYQIDSTIRITGATTGFRVDLPIRFVKKQ